MRKPLVNGLYLFIAVLLIAFSMSSCNTTKKVKYFQDIPDSGRNKVIQNAKYTPPTIEIGDIVNISVLTIDNNSASALISAANVSTGVTTSTPSTSGSGGLGGLLAAASGGNSSQQPVSGYLVSRDGNIEMPMIGKIKAVGLTTAQLKDSVYKLSLQYVKDPVVIVKLANFKVNVIGEVLKPGQYIMPDENETILDALAMAGDLTIFGKRENVLLIRDNLDGTKTTYRINLKKTDIISAPYYYVRQNDLIYVEPRSAKSDATDASQAKYYSLGAAVLSVLIILATRAK